MASNRLSAKEVDNAKLPEGKTVDYLRDGDGLELRVTASGRYWQMRYQFHGSRKVLGMNVDERERDGAPKPKEHILSTARRWRGWCRLQLAKGIDPSDARQALADADKRAVAEAILERQMAEHAAALAATRMTFSQLFERWQARQLAKGRKDGGAEIFRSFQKDVLPRIGHLYADEIKRQQIAALLHEIVERGAGRMANLTLSNLRQCFGWAIGAGLLEYDPTSHLKKDSFGGKETERERILCDDSQRHEELRLLLQERLPACNLTPKAKAAIRILLGTMVRVGELLAAKREHIDLAKREWYLPDTKNGKPHLIHLSDFAAEAMAEVLMFQDHPVWLFPDRSGTDHVCEKTLTKQIGDRQRIGKLPMSGRSKDADSLVLPGGRWTPHDLRRTASTLMGELGFSEALVERCLNHVKKDRMALIYQRQQNLPERKAAFEALGARLALLTNPDASNVVIFPPKLA